MGIGLNAALVSICTEWLSSAKLGHCSSGWWLDEKICCLEAEVSGSETCPEWIEWGGGDPIAWVVYVGCAVSRFSLPLETFCKGECGGSRADEAFSMCLVCRCSLPSRQVISSERSLLTQPVRVFPRSSVSSEGSSSKASSASGRSSSRV
jgi:hypothetical protein